MLHLRGGFEVVIVSFRIVRERESLGYVYRINLLKKEMDRAR